jgi:hypothetical protein
MTIVISAITPFEALAKAASQIPNEVIQAVNEKLCANISHTSSNVTIKQEEIVLRAIQLMGIERNVFNFKWLDFEKIYEKEGWKVEYDKPSYGDDFDAYFTFQYKRKD